MTKNTHINLMIAGLLSITDYKMPSYSRKRDLQSEEEKNKALAKAEEKRERKRLKRREIRCLK